MPESSTDRPIVQDSSILRADGVPVDLLRSATEMIILRALAERGGEDEGAVEPNASRGREARDTTMHRRLRQ